MVETYKIVRGYRDTQHREVIKRNLSLADAQRYCKWKESSSSTCTNEDGLARTALYGPWFDGYELEGNSGRQRQPKTDSLTRALVGIYQLD